MSAPGRKDGAGEGPPTRADGDIDLGQTAENALGGSTEAPIVLDGAADPFIVLDADPPATPAPQAPRGADPRVPAPHVPAVIDDTPAAPAVPAPAAQGPPPPPAPVKPRSGPEYNDTPPSIAPEHVREPLELPKWAARPATPAPRRPPQWLRPVLLVAAGLLVALGGRWAYGRMQPEPPVIASVVPAKAEPGHTVTINGSGFGTDAAAVVVRFGDRRGPVTSATGTAVAAAVPADLAGAPPGDVRVVVEVDGTPSNAIFMSLARFPRVASVAPEVALPGDEITLTGANLDTAAVRIGGHPATVVAAGATVLRVTVPAVPVVEGKAVPVELVAGRETARPASVILGHLPLVTRLAPESGEAGSTVTIGGHGFATPAEGNRVTFGPLEAIVLEATGREIKAVVPATGLFASQQPLPVLVSVGSARSTPRAFTVSRASGDVFRPRFAAMPAPGGDRARHAVVGTELGPVLLLTGRGDAPSVGARAARTAAALNAALQAAAAQPLAITTRDGTPPAVVAGSTAIVTVTPEDAETLSRGFGGVAGARVTPRRLAGYWAALLGDYVGLFARRQRPNALVEMTPRARVLMDLFAAAERRGGSAGVPQRMVVDAAAAGAESFRQLAFAAPPESRATGLALAGTWEGTMEDEGPPRPIRVVIRAGDGTLGGTLTSSAGKVAMGIPLQDLRYDRGVIRFTALLGGSARRFEGRLDGATLAGSIDHGAGATGRFALRHVE